MKATDKKEGKRFQVKPIIQFEMLTGYRVVDTMTNKALPWHFDEHELYLAESKAELKNALSGN